MRTQVASSLRQPFAYVARGPTRLLVDPWLSRLFNVGFIVGSGWAGAIAEIVIVTPQPPVVCIHMQCVVGMGVDGGVDVCVMTISAWPACID